MAERTVLLFDVDDVLITRTSDGGLSRTTGSWELLSRLQRDGGGVVASLATRQTADGARDLLGDIGAGLVRYLDMDVAAFAGDGEDLASLLTAARERAERSLGEPVRVVAVCRPADAAAASPAADDVVAVEQPGTAADAGTAHVLSDLTGITSLLDGAGESSARARVSRTAAGAAEASCAVGAVHTWGDNVWSQCGESGTDHRLLPADMPGLSGVTTVTGGGGQVVVLREDGTVWAWGRNDYGQCGDGTSENRIEPGRVEGLDGVTQLIGGGGHTLALDGDGVLWSWGHNARGDLGDGTADNRHRPVRVKGLTDVATMAWGGGHGIALDRSGHVWTWGHNIMGQLGDGTTVTKLEPIRVDLDDVVEIGGGGGHTMARTADGTLWAWGRNDRGQIGDGSFETRPSPVRISGLDGVDVASFTGGYFHALALDTSGSVWAWGNNDSGQLGDGTTENRPLPVRVDGVSGATGIAAGGGRNEWGPGGHSLAVLADGSVAAWGLNDAGQLGDGGTQDSTHPVEVKGLTGVTALVAGGGYSIALT